MRWGARAAALAVTAVVTSYAAAPVALAVPAPDGGVTGSASRIDAARSLVGTTATRQARSPSSVDSRLMT